MARREREPIPAKRARANLETLIHELKLPVRPHVHYEPMGNQTMHFVDDWHYNFNVKNRKACVNILMPDATIDLLKDECSARTPKIIVDGGAWYWKFALEVAGAALRGEKED